MLALPASISQKASMTAVAAIDMGSNSVRLLVCSGTGEPLERHMTITRLAQGVDSTGRLAPEAMDRTLRVLQHYSEILGRRGADRVRIAATSAARDAANREVFFARVDSAVGARPELLSGGGEAALAFAGATRDLPRSGGPFLTLDVGGGSTEFAYGTEEASHSISLNLGCVRVSERYLHTSPPTPNELSAAVEHVRQELRLVEREVPCREAKTWVGLAGTVTTLAAMANGLQRYDANVTQGYRLKREFVESAHDRLAALPNEERAKLLLDPERASVIVGGTVVLREVMRYFAVEELLVSERDILDGLVASLLESDARQG